MKAFILVLSLLSSLNAFAYRDQFLPAILVQSVEVGTSVTFPGGPENNEMIVKFTTAACRILSADEFFGEVLGGTIFIYQANAMDCFGPARRQTFTLNFYTSEAINQSYLLGNPLLVMNQSFHF